MIFDQIGVGR